MNDQMGYRQTGRRGESFRSPISRPRAVGPEFNPWFHHPNRFGVKVAPDWFMAKLRDLGEELSCTWNPMNERWQIWMKSATINHKICNGWKLLFIHNGPEGEYLPLDERIFARLYAASVMEHGSARGYFDRIMNEYQREEQKKEQRLNQEAVDRAMPFYDHSQISVAMRGQSNGSKFQKYHS